MLDRLSSSVLLATLILASGLLLGGCSGAAEGGKSERAAEQIREVMADQVEAWNAGDIEAFMAGYWQSDSLRFASGGDVAFGWRTTLERYQRGYPDRAAMGQLAFDDLDVDLIDSDHAVVFGRWQLTRASGEELGGLFTLLFERMPEGWLIVHDHTSSR